MTKLYHVMGVPFGKSKYIFVEAFLKEDWQFAMKEAARLRDKDLEWAKVKVVEVEDEDEDEDDEGEGSGAAAEPGKVYLFMSSFTVFGGASHGDDSVPAAGGGRAGGGGGDGAPAG